MWALLSVKRRVTQAFSLLALNSNFFGFAGERFCIPVMNCEACAVAWLGCPIGMMGSSIGYREWPLFVLGVVLVAGVLFGRFLCGWVCPMGFLQDLLYKIPSPKFKLPGFLKWPKYAFLLVTVLAVAYALGKASSLFYCSFCPTATMQVVLPSMVMYRDWAVDANRWIRFAVLAAVLLLAVLSLRSFCKIMCPVGALVALTNKFSFMRIRLNASTCVRCRKCDKKCPMDVQVMGSQEHGRAINRDAECIECLTCEEVCPVNAISNNSRVLRGHPAGGN